jgi:hypothetical protein
VIDPLVVAAALSVTVDPAPALAPAGNVETETVGGAATVTVRGDDVVRPPLLSVARAVKE